MNNSSRKKTIMVVDDDVGILEVIKIILEEQGYNIVIIADASGVLKHIEQIQPQLILLDIWMSGVDGREVTKSLKSQKTTCHIPVILISALSEIEQLAQDSGADGFIAKPFDINELTYVIEQHILT